jgi:hypothetical protein
MGDLYLQQGHREDALRVYRALLAERPGDARLAAKLRSLESPPAKPPAESATAFLRRVWRGEPPPVPDVQHPLTSAHELTGALEAAFAIAPRQSEPVAEPAETPGEPTQPAGDVISLDAVFGDQVGRGSAPEVPTSEPAGEAPPAAAGRGGFSFDDFFGAGPGAAGTPARSTTRNSRPNRPQPEDEDLDQFQAWLKGLKT